MHLKRLSAPAVSESQARPSSLVARTHICATENDDDPGLPVLAWRAGAEDSEGDRKQSTITSVPAINGVYQLPLFLFPGNGLNNGILFTLQEKVQLFSTLLRSTVVVCHCVAVEFDMSA
jgi:hypothetical protein